MHVIWIHRPHHDYFSVHICPYGSIDTYTVAYFKIYVEVAPNSLVNVASTVSPYESGHATLKTLLSAVARS